MKNPKHDLNHDHDRDPDRDHANDNGTNKGAVVPAPASGAMTSLVALEVMMNGVDTSSVIGRSGKPLLLYKSRENAWVYGQRRTVVETGSRWAINPTTFQWGSVCFDNNNKRIGEHLVSVSKPKPDPTKLPDKGYPWQDEWAVDMKCVDGADAGTEVVFKTNTDGGLSAVAGVLDEVKNRLNSGQHGGNVAPVALLESDSYSHSQYGRTWFPVLTLVDWMPLGGPAPAPKSTPPTSPPPAEQPRRRRVA